MAVKNPFIVFEGIEGVGKSTQIEKLAEYISSLNLNVVKTFEPGGTILGKEIRKLLLESSNNTKISSTSELLLFGADRAQHIEEVIRPNLNAGNTVICDRFIYSTIAYQCYGRGLELSSINTINNLVLNNIHPDLVILLDIDPKVGLSRAKKRQELDRIESLELTFHEKVRNGFLEISKQNKDIFIVINANNSIEEISKEIIQEVKSRFGF